jgi:hydrogenase assembly chaperone HypC/HupF
MTSSPALVCGSDHCITCGDDGIPMVVLTVDARDGLATCADGDGARTTVETALVAPVAIGDQLLVHAGVAIVALDPEEAIA